MGVGGLSARANALYAELAHDSHPFFLTANDVGVVVIAVIVRVVIVL